MKSLQEHWQFYRGRVYPDGMVADQDRQVHQAFFAGAFVALKEATNMAAMPKDAAVAGLHALLVESVGFVRRRRQREGRAGQTLKR